MTVYICVCVCLCALTALHKQSTVEDLTFSLIDLRPALTLRTEGRGEDGRG